MKNCEVALWTALVRAIATVPRSLPSPLSASLRIGSRGNFCVRSSRKPPPWIMKSSITRWKIVSS